jgi:hypothetical protein
MNGRIKDNANMGEVVSGQHDDGKMTVSAAATSGVNGMGVGIELTLKDL